MVLRAVCVLQHLHEVLTVTEAGRDSNINNSMENIMPRVKLIDASLKVSDFSPTHHMHVLRHCLASVAEAVTNSER